MYISVEITKEQAQSIANDVGKRWRFKIDGFVSQIDMPSNWIDYTSREYPAVTINGAHLVELATIKIT